MLTGKASPGGSLVQRKSRGGLRTVGNVLVRKTKPGPTGSGPVISKPKNPEE